MSCLVVASLSALAFSPVARPPVMLSKMSATCTSHAHNHCTALPQCRLRAVSRASPAQMFGGQFGGGFLNMGTPELLVIGAVAWAVLGPKELFRLSKEAGNLREWQQLGMNAKETFTSALENELKDDEAEAAIKARKPFYEGWAQEAEAAMSGATMSSTAVAPPAKPSGSSSSSSSSSSSADGFDSVGTGSDPSSVPTLEEMAAARAAGDDADPYADGDKPLWTPEEEEAVRESLYETLGEPSANQANFEEQISGARNAAVMAEYPQELTLPEPDGSDLDVTASDEMLIANKIAEAENEIELLKAEKKVLALKRKLLEENAERAKQMADERLAKADERVAKAEAAVEEAEAGAEGKASSP